MASLKPESMPQIRLTNHFAFKTNPVQEPLMVYRTMLHLHPLHGVTSSKQLQMVYFNCYGAESDTLKCSFEMNVFVTWYS